MARDPCHMTRSGPEETHGTEPRTPERRGIPARRSAAPHVRRIVARPETFQTPKPRRCRGSSVPVIGSRTTERQPTCGRYRKPSAFVSCAISATYRDKPEHAFHLMFTRKAEEAAPPDSLPDPSGDYKPD